MYIIRFNEELEFLSKSIIELIKINESSHENAVIIVITKNDLTPPLLKKCYRG